MDIKTTPVDTQTCEPPLYVTIITEPVENDQPVTTKNNLSQRIKLPLLPFDVTIKIEPAENNQPIKTEIPEFSQRIKLPLPPLDLTENNRPVKTEPTKTPVILPRPVQNQPFVFGNNPIVRENKVPKRYMCRMCLKMCTSQHEFYMHVRKHKPKCNECEVSFKSWKNFDKHIPHCARRFGVTHMPQKAPQVKVPKLPFNCQLCRRKYETQGHLIAHQIHRCKKRYVSDAWIVKI